MSRQEIVDRLAQVVEEVKSGKGISPGHQARWARISLDAVSSLGDAMLVEPALEQLEGVWVHNPAGGGAVNLKVAGIYLVDRALDIGVETVVEDLFRFAETGEVDLTTVYLVEGITIPETVTLGGGYSFELFHTLPKPHAALPIFGKANVPAHGWGNPPSCALVHRTRFKVPMQSPAEREAAPMFHVDSSDVRTTMTTALNAAMLASTGAPQFRQQYHVITSPGWPYMDCGGFAGSERFPVPVPFARPVQIERLAEYFELMQSQDGRLEMALSKLQSSRQRISNAERVIDLGTCMEMLLTHGEGQSSEITFKISSRAAWLLGSDATSRVEIFSRARGLYGARSQAVHSGIISTPKGANSLEREAELNRLLASYDQLCRDLIIAVCSTSFWTTKPDWIGLVLDAADVSAH